MIGRRAFRRHVMLWSLALSVGVILTAITSNWLFVQYRRQNGYAQLSMGSIQVGWSRVGWYPMSHYPNAMGFDVGFLSDMSFPPTSWNWRWRWDSTPGTVRVNLPLSGNIPLWSVLLAVALPGTVAAVSRVRAGANPGVCDNCGYDRSTIAPQSPCPECGTTPLHAAADVGLAGEA
jgi:hypothetical protein